MGALMDGERWWHEGKRITRRLAKPYMHFVLALDPGKQQDPAALCAMEFQSTPQDTFSLQGGTLRQDTRESFVVRYLQRFPLGTSYFSIRDRVAEIAGRAPFLDACSVVLDATGAGEPVAEIFDEAGIEVTRIVYTAGLAAEQKQRRPEIWHVPKAVLVQTLDAYQARGAVVVPADIQERAVLVDEMQAFQRKTGATGRHTYDAKSGAHDDVLNALMLATWYAVTWREHYRPGMYGSGHIRGLI
jgi:hypothetical protein